MSTAETTLYRIEVGLREDLPDPAGAGLAGEFKTLGLPAPERARTVRLYWLEGPFERAQMEAVARELFSDPVTERCAIDAPVYETNGQSVRSVEVVRKPGVMDPVVGSIRKALADRGLHPTLIATGRKALFYGDLDHETLRLAGRRILANESIEEIHIDCAAPVHRIRGQAPFVLRMVPLRGKSDAELEQISKDGTLSLTLAEMKSIVAHYELLGRDPTDVELETIAQTWSEHCRHKTLKGCVEFTGPGGQKKRYENLLKETIVHATETVNHPACLSVFKDNAGVVAFDEQWAVTFKVETHNHPSAIEPYGGAGTGIGGVIRDTLGTGLGAKPIANTDVFCFGLPDTPFDALPAGTLHPRRVMSGVVSGVRDYGNRMGIPTVNGAVHFDPRYVGNPLVYAGSVGLIPRNQIEKAARPGDLIVALGGRTGRDGIHGATFSSVELTSESEAVNSGAVQIGNAIEEKKVLDVMLRARDEGLYSCVTDCGAGGFSSAVGEMGEHTGAEVDLETVPLKYAGLSYTEIWISEAQERMVLAVPPEHWARLQALCREEDVEATAIGRFASDGQLKLRYRGIAVGEMAMSFLHGGLPKVERKAVWNGPSDGGAALRAEPSGAPPQAHADVLKAILAHPTVASKHRVIRQYDHEVQGRTVLKPLVGASDDGPGDAAVITPVLGSTKGIALSNGLCPQFTDLDPREMAKLAVDEALRNSVAVGGDPAHTFILDNFSWGRTSRPEQLGSLVLTCEGATEAAIAYGLPFISGKDSLNNEYAFGEKTIAIPGTLLVSALAIVPDVRECVTMDLKRAGNLIFLVGETGGELGASHYNLVTARSPLDGACPRVDLERAKKTYFILHACIREKLIASCHDLSEGGLAVAAAEMAFAGGLGLLMGLEHVPGGAELSDEQLLFSESPSRFLVEVEREKSELIQNAFRGLPCACIGSVDESPILAISRPAGPDQVRTLVHAGIEELKAAWLGTPNG
ncbi:MAG: phosphoribosylformylglycinamidine synthase subunit PurL [Planctomycetes bacterium]|nr:phosphoribosylformylglycinamidine synthase subunit PurL [Planctomycetota bacterium]